MNEKKYNSTTLRGKLRVCKYLESDERLKNHVPHTVSFTMAHLKYMSLKYKSMYIKVDVGSMGIGVYKVNRLLEGYMLFTTHNRRQIQNKFKTISQLYKHLKSQQHHKMIIQRDVNLDLVNGRPYDIRVMVQRKPGKSWNCTGFLIKVGAPNKIVTNYYQGGKIYTLNELLKMKNYPTSERRKITNYLTQKALEVSNTLSQKRSGMNEMGIDFAYSRKKQLWILEVNSNHPQFHPLKKLDRTAYNRMISFAKSYGRH
jgi:hypothetical protein